MNETVDFFEATLKRAESATSDASKNAYLMAALRQLNEKTLKLEAQITLLEKLHKHGHNHAGEIIYYN